MPSTAKTTNAAFAKIARAIDRGTLPQHRVEMLGKVTAYVEGSEALLDWYLKQFPGGEHREQYKGRTPAKPGRTRGAITYRAKPAQPDVWRYVTDEVSVQYLKPHVHGPFAAQSDQRRGSVLIWKCWWCRTSLKASEAKALGL
jgi:hypothetical protein